MTTYIYIDILGIILGGVYGARRPVFPFVKIFRPTALWYYLSALVSLKCAPQKISHLWQI